MQTGGEGKGDAATEEVAAFDTKLTVNFSTKKQQRYAFREQVKLACELQLPLFLHEREAHEDLLEILDDVTAEHFRLPPIVVHCFTGTEEEALTYIYQTGLFSWIYRNNLQKRPRSSSTRSSP